MGVDDDFAETSGVCSDGKSDDASSSLCVGSFFMSSSEPSAAEKRAGLCKQRFFCQRDGPFAIIIRRSSVACSRRSARLTALQIDVINDFCSELTIFY